MNKSNEIIGAVAVAIILVTLLVAGFAIIHAFMALLPVLGVLVIVGALVWLKNKG